MPVQTLSLGARWGGHPQKEDGQVAVVMSDPAPVGQPSIPSLLEAEALHTTTESFGVEQKHCTRPQSLLGWSSTRTPSYWRFFFFEREELPLDTAQAWKTALQAPLFVMEDDTLFFLDPGQGQQKRALVPSHFREQVLEESHQAVLGGYFSGKCTYSVLVHHWYIVGRDACPHSVIRTQLPRVCCYHWRGEASTTPDTSHPVQRPFQIIGVDVMDLQVTKRGNRHVLVFQDFLTKWPLVFQLPDQRAIFIAKAMVEDVEPLFGVPKAFLSDHDNNLLSHLMKDLCQLLGVEKFNTTAYHPQCDGMVERFNWTLKSAIPEACHLFWTTAGPVLAWDPLGIL